MFKKICTLTALSVMTAGLLSVQGCKTGYNKRYTNTTGTVTPPDCAQEANNSSLSSEGVNILNLLASLTCNEADTDGALMGQNTGFGNQIVEEDGKRSYEALVDSLDKKPAIVSIDYEHDKLFTLDELKEANAQLKTHWDAGGIVMISWMPLNPWVNDASDIEDEAGDANDLKHTDAVNLEDLLSEDTEANTTWLRKLDLIAEALQDLEDKNVPVLWRPLPAMNTTESYWWGLEASYKGTDENDDASLYTALWEHMYNYFTDEKELDNLLWVYSPAEGGDLPTDASVSWAYPGDDFVDVVGAIAQNDGVTIPDYKELNDLGKPFGMGQLNPLPGEQAGQTASQGIFAGSGADGNGGTFDNRTYRDRLEGTYKNVAFWVTWHSYEHETGHSNLALPHNLYAKEMANDSYILDLTTVNSKNLR